METPRRPKRILVADDYPDAAESLAALLAYSSSSPVEVSFVLDGAQAVESALAGRPDMVVFDIEMPRLDGVDAAIAIRAVLGLGAPLMVGLTGNARRAADPRTRRAFDHTLSKPADVDALLTLLRTLD